MGRHLIVFLYPGGQRVFGLATASGTVPPALATAIGTGSQSGVPPVGIPIQSDIGGLANPVIVLMLRQHLLQEIPWGDSGQGQKRQEASKNSKLLRVTVMVELWLRVPPSPAGRPLRPSPGRSGG
jgi:hypothetical protein